MRWRSLERWRAAATALAALALAACAPEPGPFAHKQGTAGALLGPVSGGGGVVVAAVEGAPAAAGRRLREAMAEALALYDIPAATEGANRRTRFLKGRAHAEPRANGLARLDLAWELTDAAGRPVGRQPLEREVARAAWEAGDAALMKALARDSAAAVAALIQEPAPAAVRRARNVILHVWEVAGVPPVAAVALRRAMEAALRQRDYAIRAEIDEEGLIVAGSVSLGPPSGDMRPVEVVWAVLDGGGRELGRLSQKNALPAAHPAAALGAAAPAIAEAAAGGMVELLQRLSPAALEGAGAG